jgi:SAM-dependent methyltransferase
MSSLQNVPTSENEHQVTPTVAPAARVTPGVASTAYDDAVSTMIENVRIATHRRQDSYHFPWLRPGYMMQFHEVERAVLRLVARNTEGSLRGLKILDIGCGSGGWLREFIKWGAEPESLYGIDAIEDRVANARRLTPAGVTLICGSAANLEFDNKAFDLVMMFECLCMMTDETMRARMASEALRVLKPSGTLLFYDFRYRRPGLGDVFRPLGRREVKRLFPGCKCHLKSIHPFPPVSRKLAALMPSAWNLLNLFPPLRTSYVGSIRKRER